MEKLMYKVPRGTLLKTVTTPRTLETLSRQSVACMLWNVNRFHKVLRSQYLWLNMQEVTTKGEL